jgi:serine/threonine protein kinase
VYVVFDAADTDLHQLIRSPQPLPPEHARFLTYQILRALKFLHSAGVVHRDLKPSNVLVDAGGGARLCDLGLARAGAGSNAEGGTFPEYVVTRWYRAPELLLACGGAAAAAPTLDLWSVGCVLGELLGRKPLFPGRDAAHTLALVLAVTGAPGAAEAARLAGGAAPAVAALAAAPCAPADLGRIFPAAPPAARGLLRALLALDPAARPTAAQALAHPWFRGLSDPDDEPAAPAPLPADPEVDAMGAAAVRAAVFAEMCAANPALLRA